MASEGLPINISGDSRSEERHSGAVYSLIIMKWLLLEWLWEGEEIRRAVTPVRGDFYSSVLQGPGRQASTDCTHHPIPAPKPTGSGVVGSRVGGVFLQKSEGASL